MMLMLQQSFFSGVHSPILGSCLPAEPSPDPRSLCWQRTN